MSKSVKLKDNTFLKGEICDMGSNYVKFSNGLMICFDRVDVTMSTTVRGFSDSRLYYGYLTNWATYPQTFKEKPIEVINLYTTTNIFTVQPYGNGTVSKPSDVYPWSHNGPSTYNDIGIGYIAIGKWK